jgi:DNA-binding NarL/FixJ family response regulator
VEQQTRIGTGDQIRSVLVIDDHPLFRDVLVMTLQSALSLSTIRTANTLTSALNRLTRDFDPDAIVLDLNLPDVKGIDGLLRLKAAAPRTPVVVVSALGDDAVISAVMTGGAAGFIRKDASRETLIDAFRRIWAGDVYTPEGYSPSRQGDGAGEPVERAVQRLSSLTTQQMRILELLCEGKLNKQIAYELSIAETTVKAHVTAILRKLGVHSRTQAVLIANEARLPFRSG